MSYSVESRILAAARKTGFPVEAFLFVLQGLPRADAPGAHDLHIDGAELCRRLRDRAVAMYGESARAQLERWGIRSTGDFGHIVFSLIAEGLAGKTEQDAIGDFGKVIRVR